MHPAQFSEYPGLGVGAEMIPSLKGVSMTVGVLFHVYITSGFRGLPDPAAGWLSMHTVH